MAQLAAWSLHFLYLARQWVRPVAGSNSDLFLSANTSCNDRLRKHGLIDFNKALKLYYNFKSSYYYLTDLVAHNPQIRSLVPMSPM